MLVAINNATGENRARILNDKELYQSSVEGSNDGVPELGTILEEQEGEEISSPSCPALVECHRQEGQEEASAALVRSMLVLINSEVGGGDGKGDGSATERRLVYCKRQMERLATYSWPAHVRTNRVFAAFENSHVQLLGLPIDVLVELLSYLSSIELEKLSNLSRCFAFPQPTLPSSASLPATVIAFLGKPSCWDNASNSILWIRSAPTETVHSLVTRERSRLHGTYYTMFYQDSQRGNESIALMARQHGSVFHIFNVAKGYQRERLRKGGGNYVGALVSNYLRMEHVMVDAEGRQEYGALSFRRVGIDNPWFPGPHPRCCHILLPVLSRDRTPTHIQAAQNFSIPGVGLKNPLRAHLTSGVETPEGTFLVKTREPVFDAYTNSYRLNFSGRVTVPSIKNLQIVHDDYPNETLCQFGKTDKNRFHLDFRRPFNAFQAFCIALASFSHH